MNRSQTAPHNSSKKRSSPVLVGHPNATRHHHLQGSSSNGMFPSEDSNTNNEEEQDNSSSYQLENHLKSRRMRHLIHKHAELDSNYSTAEEEQKRPHTSTSLSSYSVDSDLNTSPSLKNSHSPSTSSRKTVLSRADSTPLHSENVHLLSQWRHSNLRAIQKMDGGKHTPSRNKRKRKATAPNFASSHGAVSSSIPHGSRKRKLTSASAVMSSKGTADETILRDMSTFFQANRKLFLNKGGLSSHSSKLRQGDGLRKITKSPSMKKKSSSSGSSTGQKGSAKLHSSKNHASHPLYRHTNGHMNGGGRVDHHRTRNTFLTDGIASDLIPSLEHDKPPLLLYLEDYIDRELIALDQSSAVDNESQYIHVFRECFRLMAEHFSTYGEFLQDVNNNYELTYELLQANYSENKQNDATQDMQEEEDAQKINTHLYGLHLRQKELGHEQGNEQLRQELSASEGNVLHLTKQHDAILEKYTVMKAKTDHLRENLQELRDNLKAEVENKMIPLKDDMLVSLQTQDDIRRMKDRTHQLQKDASALRQKLVSEDVYEEELRKQKENLKEIDDLHQKLKFLRVANRRLRQQISELKQNTVNHDDMSEKLVILQNAVTPRPKWDDYTSQWSHLADTWKGKSSQEICRWISKYYSVMSEKIEKNKRIIQTNQAQLSFLDSAVGEEEKNHQKYFYGLGNGEDVPSYMRYVGRISKKMISKRDCELILEELWEERKKELKKSKDSGNPPLSFQDFFSEFIKIKYGVIRAVRAEWIYNLTWACERYIHDADCELFIRILRGEISEDAYKEQFDMIDKLHDSIVKADKKGNGKVKKKSIMKVVKKLFKTKTPERLKEVSTSLNEFGKGKTINYKKLFEETRDKTQSQFIEALRDQFLEETIEYTDEVEAAIRAQDSENSGFISVEQVVTAFNNIDPQKSKKDIDRYINNCLSEQHGPNSTRIQVVPPGQPTQRGSIPDSAFKMYTEAFIQRLRSGKLLKRTTPRVSEKKRKKSLSKKKRKSSTKLRARSESKSSQNVDGNDVDNSKLQMLKVPPRTADSSATNGSIDELVDEFERHHERSSGDLMTFSVPTLDTKKTGGKK